LVTPFATYTTTPPSTSSVLERPWASPFTGFPSTASGTPLGARALLSLPPASPPSPRARSVSRQSPTGPCSRGESVLRRRRQGRTPVCSGRRSRLEVQCSSERAPTRSGSRFGRGASPRTLGWGDVPVHPGRRVSGIERVEQSVSGPSALVRFFTLQRTMLRPQRWKGRPTSWVWSNQGACVAACTTWPLPSRSASSPGHCCPDASPARVDSDKCFGSTTSHRRAAADPGPAARHRRSSVIS
jgi:hypothetical protein